MRRVFVGLALGAVLCTAEPGFAQQGTAEIQGRVTDEQSAALPGVAIVVTNEATGVYRELVSSGDGTYSVAQLVPGRYRVVATLEGFRTFERRDLVLPVGQTLPST